MRESFNQHNIKIPAGSTSGNVKVLCPRCSHDRKKKNDPCLSVNVAEGVWNCHNCGWRGKLKDHQERQWRSVANKVSNELPAENIYAWFAARGISRNAVDRAKIFQTKRFVAAVGKERHCIAFPYYVGDVLVNVKFRDGEKHFSQLPDSDKVLFKLNDLAGQTECVICEGEIDALSFDEIGITSAVSVPDGAVNPNDASADGKLKCLDNCWEYFEPMTDIYLATDNDAPGRRLCEELARRLGKQRCLVVRYPADCKDANDVLTKYGKEMLLNCVGSAEPYPMEGTFQVNDFYNGMLSVYQDGYPTAAKTGIAAIDEMITWAQGELTVWSGIPSHFKSSLCDQVHIHLCEQSGWRVAIFSPEHYPPLTHLHRLSEQRTGKVLLPPKNHDEVRMTQDELSAALQWLHKRFYYIQPDGDT
ncbi:MAG: toprim domain-containing protein, partial [Chlorobi bacterium]|nr:toprim domain-containing protein [Chlorobiota bacterium]